MKQENKRCRSCCSFRAYYTMGYCSIMKENNGYCSRHERVANKSDSCDQWHRRLMPRVKCIKVAVKSIPEIYKKIAVIEEILKEDAELRKIYNETDSIDNL